LTKQDISIVGETGHFYCGLTDAKYPLTGKNTPPILRCAKSNILSIILSMRGVSLMRFRTDHPAMAALNPLLHMENQARQKLKKFFHSA
jgi:hypothetical protein